MYKSEASVWDVHSPPNIVRRGSPVTGSGRVWSEMELGRHSTDLMCYDFLTSVISWIQSYLSNRKQKVLFYGSFSNVKHVKCGVSQDSSLGPLLFSIYQ
jgi:hypothetical protein